MGSKSGLIDRGASPLPRRPAWVLMGLALLLGAVGWLGVTSVHAQAQVVTAHQPEPVSGSSTSGQEVFGAAAHRDSLLQQGAGMANIDGAVEMARALRTFIANAMADGTLAPGAPPLVGDKTAPNPISVTGGQTVSWSCIVYAGGNHVFRGDALITRCQSIWHPRSAWASGVAKRTVPDDSQGPGYASYAFVNGYPETAAPNQPLLTASVVSGVTFSQGLFLSEDGVSAATGAKVANLNTSGAFKGEN